MTIQANQYPKGVTMRQIHARCGGLSALARAVKRRPQTVIKWTIVPDPHVQVVLDLSGWPVEVIRPDLALPAEALA